MALEDHDIGEFTSEEEVESEEELGPTPIPSSSQQEQQQEQKQKRKQKQKQKQKQEEDESEEELGPTPIPSSSQHQQEQESAGVLRSSQQDADGDTQHQSIGGSEEEGSREDLSQALSSEDKVWMQKLDERIAQCRKDMAELRENKGEELGEENTTMVIGGLGVDGDDSEGVVALSGEQLLHQVKTVEKEPNHDKVESNNSLLAAEMRKFIVLEKLFDQIEKKKQHVEKDLEGVAMMVEAKQRIGRKLEAQKKKVAAIISSEPQSPNKG